MLDSCSSLSEATPGKNEDPTWGEQGPHVGSTGILHREVRSLYEGKKPALVKVISGLLVITSNGNLVDSPYLTPAVFDT